FTSCRHVDQGLILSRTAGRNRPVVIEKAQGVVADINVLAGTNSRRVVTNTDPEAVALRSLRHPRHSRVGAGSDGHGVVKNIDPQNLPVGSDPIVIDVPSDVSEDLPVTNAAAHVDDRLPALLGLVVA